MSYGEFTSDKLGNELHLAIEEEDVCSAVEPIDLRPAFVEILDENLPLALSIDTEKARSELIIAPVLVELRRHLRHSISLFSGIEQRETALVVDEQEHLIDNAGKILGVLAAMVCGELDVSGEQGS